jgi:hypothetical protein
MPPVLGQRTIGQILLEHFKGRFSIYLVDDISFGARHRPFAAYRDIGNIDGPDWQGLARK